MILEGGGGSLRSISFGMCFCGGGRGGGVGGECQALKKELCCSRDVGQIESWCNQLDLGVFGGEAWLDVFNFHFRDLTATASVRQASAVGRQTLKYFHFPAKFLSDSVWHRAGWVPFTPFCSSLSFASWTEIPIGTFLMYRVKRVDGVLSRLLGWSDGESDGEIGVIIVGRGSVEGPDKGGCCSFVG